MQNQHGNGSGTPEPSGLETLFVENESEIERPAAVNSEVNSEDARHWVAPQAFLFTLLLAGWQCVVIYFYLRLHNISVVGTLFRGETIPVLRYVTADKSLGPAIEIIAWAGTAVIVRRLVKLARDARGDHVNLRQDLLEAVADYAESVFLTFMLIMLLSVPKITLGTGIDLSLKDASADLVIALSCVLGWSVRETRLLIARIFRLLFSGHGTPNGLAGAL